MGGGGVAGFPAAGFGGGGGVFPAGFGGAGGGLLLPAAGLGGAGGAFPPAAGGLGGVLASVLGALSGFLALSFFYAGLSFCAPYFGAPSLFAGAGFLASLAPYLGALFDPYFFYPCGLAYFGFLSPYFFYPWGLPYFGFLSPFLASVLAPSGFLAPSAGFAP